MPVLVSFYTDNWLYPQHAARLAAECDHYGIAHDICRLETTGDWMQNTQLKARFIRDRLERHGEIIWLDVDSALLRKPDLFKRSLPSDLGLVRHTTLPRHWHVGMMMFRQCAGVAWLLDEWIDRLESCGGTDEAALDITWNRLADRLRVTVATLPITYHALPVRRGYAPGSVIGMGLSMDSTKMAMKQRNAQKR